MCIGYKTAAWDNLSLVPVLSLGVCSSWDMTVGCVEKSKLQSWVETDAFCKLLCLFR
jgi:hypothetical protein